MDPNSSSTGTTTTAEGVSGGGGGVGGQIHFVTPTNRWMGSIPLSTLDPLTLEPLSTYVRPDPPRGDDDGAYEEEEADMKDRTTNIAGDPISLILARLQTAPQICACRCTVPDPPKHSDYYHAQHLLRLLFQTQRVRSRSLKVHVPEFFKRLGEEDSDDDDDDGDDEGEISQEQGWEQERPRDSFIIPIDGVNNNSTTTLIPPNQHHQHHQQSPPLQQHSQQRKKKKKIPRYVHSLIQNRAFRNPLTNTEIEGDPTFFVVLEPGKGGWWHEPWAMATRPQGVQGFHSLVHQHHHHQEEEKVDGKDVVEEKGGIGGEGGGEKRKELEKELRKERWRQGRIVNLELEAQHEMDWRRWNRSQATLAAESVAAEVGQGQSSVGGRNRMRGRKMMRFKLGKDVALLDPSERGLRLPRRVRSPSSLADMDVDRRHHRGEQISESSFSLSKKKKEAETIVGSKTTFANINHTTLGGGLYRSSAIQASAVLDDVELEDIRIHQKPQDQNQEQQEDDVESTKKGSSQQHLSGLLGRRRRMGKKWMRRLARVHRPFTTPPSSESSSPASTSASPSPLQGFSFLPWWDPDPRPFEMPTTKLSPFAISTLPEPVAKLFGGTSIYSRVRSKADAIAQSPLSTNDAFTTTTTTTTEAPAGGIPKNVNTAGCQWIPVAHGDRVAVMIGTSKDFLLFPSFQRLLFRNSSREDFEDRVARVNRIACLATAVVVTNGGASRGGGGGEGVEQQVREQGARMQEEIRRQQAREREREERGDVSAMEQGGVGGQEARSTGRSSWMAWMSPRRHQQGGGTNSGDNAATSTITTTAARTSGGAGADLGTRPQLPPSNESTTAFVTSSNASSSSSSRSLASASGDDHFGDEKCRRLDDNESRLSPANNNKAGLPNSDNMGDPDTLDEKAASGFNSPLTTTVTSTTPATHKATAATNNSNESREGEEARQRWQALEEQFLREDYDSSEYSYTPSSEEDEDELPQDYDGPYYSSEESDSSDDDDDDEYESDEFNGEGRSRAVRRRQRQQGGETGSRSGSRPRPQWRIRDWLYFFTFCTPHPRTLTSTTPSSTTSSTSNAGRQERPLESRRARRRRLRRERWLRIQHRQREQESEVLHRYLPVAIRRRMTAQDVHRVCLAAEFCRFYLTILMSVLIIGAIVYAAVNVEASPKEPKVAVGVPTTIARLKEVVVPVGTGGGGSGGGGGSLQRVPEQWTTSTTSSAEDTGGGGSRSGVWKGDKKEGENGKQQQQQQLPLGMVEV